MVNAKNLKKRSQTSKQVTVVTNKPVPQEAKVDPYQPFYGVDGKKYVIAFKPNLNTKTNCYAFAMGWAMAADDKYSDYIPGFLCGKSFEYEWIVDLIKEDLEAVGRKVYEIVYDIPESLPDGEGYWVKGVMCYEGEHPKFHIMRKDKNSGRWIHKMGWEYPPKVVVKKTEFKDKLDVVIEMAGLQMFRKEVILDVVRQNFPPHMYKGKELIRSEIETDDSAPYVAYTGDDTTLTFEPLWAMRISEP